MDADRQLAGIDIGQITVDQIPGFHRALDAVARERRFLTMLEAPPLAETHAFVQRGIAVGNPRLVAVRGNEVVGWCDITRHFFPSHAHRGSLGMGVIAAHRGRGIGGLLLRATLDQAWTAGFKRVELDVHCDNSSAIALYAKVGFTREGVQRNASLIDGVYRDAISMAIIVD